MCVNDPVISDVRRTRRVRGPGAAGESDRCRGASVSCGDITNLNIEASLCNWNECAGFLPSHSG